MSWRVDRREGTMVDMASTNTSAPATGAEEFVEQPAKPYRLLYVIAGMLAAIGIVSAAAIIVTRGDQSHSHTPPPITSTNSGTTPTATPARTSPEERAMADAAASFVAYQRARDEVAHAGGDKGVVARAATLTTKEGTERRYLVQTFATELRDKKFRSSGWSRVSTRVQSVDLSAKPPRVELTACLDQTDVTVTKDGQPFDAPRFVRYGVTMHLVGEKWLVDLVQNPTVDVKPPRLTWCEP